MVDDIIGIVGPWQDDLRDGHKGIALLEQGLNDTGQGLRGVEGGIVKEDDGTGLDLAHHPLGNLRGGKILPVQAVHIPNRFKRLGSKGYRGY